jgi:hemerythrin-like domain-containing protein
MRVTDSLEQDHRIIEIMLPAVQRLGQRAQFTWQEQAPAQQEAFDKDGAEMAVGFLRTFVDGYHHGKEELHLFKAMERRGVHRDVGLVFHLLEEHGRGRRHVRAMSDSLATLRSGDAASLRSTSAGAAEGKPEAAKAFADNAIAYVKLLGHHIREEDAELWPLVGRVLSEDDDARLMESFAQVEGTVMGEGGREPFRAQAQQIDGRVGP